MPRPITLFTGQWADLPLSKLAPLVKSMGAGGHVDDEPWPGDDRAGSHDEPMVTIGLAGAVTVLLAQ